MPLLQRIRKLLCAEPEVIAQVPEQWTPDSIKQRGWLQWSFIGQNDLPFVLKSTALERSQASSDLGTRMLIVSQSCDLVHHSYAAEPFAEAYLCAPLPVDAAQDGNLTAGKNPRELQVPFMANGEECWYRLHSSGRVLLPRQRLAAIDPDPKLLLSSTSVRILQRWIINRIVRAAFPDVFNERTRKALTKLEGQLKKKGTSLLGLCVNVTPWEELPEEKAYLVDFVGLVDEELDLQQRQALEQILGGIASAYSACEGVEVCDHQILDEDEASMSLQRTHRLFPLDYLSLRPKPGGDLPPTG